MPAYDLRTLDELALLVSGDLLAEQRGDLS